MSLDKLMVDADVFISTEFGLRTKQSKLFTYSSDNWQSFCQVNGFEQSSRGLYIPKTYSAYVDSSSEFLVANAFHEFFGHGLFCEQSELGKELVEHEQRGDNTDIFLYDEIDRTTQQLGICDKNIGNYEGFALWLEALLCEVTGNQKLWEEKKKHIKLEYVKLFNFFKEAEITFTRSGLLKKMGFFRND